MTEQPITAADVMGRWEYFPDNEIFDMPGEEGEQEVDRIHEAIKALEQQGSISEMFKLSYLFRDGHGSWDAEYAYIHALERMSGYPLAELFTTARPNDMILHLRQRCWNGQIIVYDDKIKTFYEVATQFFALEDAQDEDFSRILSSEIVQKMTNHEVRLTLELIFILSLAVDFREFNYLISRLEDQNDAN
jgi:hypothetical protein